MRRRKRSFVCHGPARRGSATSLQREPETRRSRCYTDFGYSTAGRGVRSSLKPKRAATCNIQHSPDRALCCDLATFPRIHVECTLLWPSTRALWCHQWPRKRKEALRRPDLRKGLTCQLRPLWSLAFRATSVSTYVHGHSIAPHVVFVAIEAGVCRPEPGIDGCSLRRLRQVHVKDRVITVPCGHGPQTVKWLGHVAIARYDDKNCKGWLELGAWPCAIDCCAHADTH